jgi:allantoate deiminase
LRLPFAIEIVAFGDEESVRFPTTLSGSRALAGTFDNTVLERQDANGITFEQALIAFGGDPAQIKEVARRPGEIAAYIELHIEQGPVLEVNGAPVGIVTAISGATRLSVLVRGVAGHAGTVPMALRTDALAAAAEMILVIEKYARETSEFVATVGRIEDLSRHVRVRSGPREWSW